MSYIWELRYGLRKAHLALGNFCSIRRVAFFVADVASGNYCYMFEVCTAKWASGRLYLSGRRLPLRQRSRGGESKCRPEANYYYFGSCTAKWALKRPYFSLRRQGSNGGRAQSKYLPEEGNKCRNRRGTSPQEWRKVGVRAVSWENNWSRRWRTWGSSVEDYFPTAVPLRRRRARRHVRLFLQLQ